MSSPIVRDDDETVIKALEPRAARYGGNAEAEPGALLADALPKTRRRPLAEVLADMPDVGGDADFARMQDDEAARVFD